MLAESTEQRNFDHIFASILVFDGTRKEDFFGELKDWNWLIYRVDETFIMKLYGKKEVM